MTTQDIKETQTIKELLEKNYKENVCNVQTL